MGRWRVGVAMVGVAEDHMARRGAPSGRFVSVSVGNVHSCGVREDGKAICWGTNAAWNGTHYGSSDSVGRLDVPNITFLVP